MEIIFQHALSPSPRRNVSPVKTATIHKAGYIFLFSVRIHFVFFEETQLHTSHLLYKAFTTFHFVSLY